MPEYSDIRIITGNLKGLFIVAAGLMAAMALISLALGEPEDTPGFMAGLAISLAIVIAIQITTPQAPAVELKHAIIVAALAYIFIPAISAVPYLLNAGMTPLDSFFEAISGWTGSGFSMIPSPVDVSRSTQLWRSVTQWIGGAGVILLMVTILIRPGTSTYVLYQSETRKEKIKPSIRSTIRTIWRLYLLLTVLSVLLLYIAGLQAWDALNTAMTGISTGGFSLYGNSIAHYDSLAVELSLLPIMIAGALPFAVMYMAFRRHLSALIYDVQVRAFMAVIVAGCAILAVQNYFFNYGNIFSALKFSVFQFISAVTCTGFQTADLSGWSPTALLILSIAMVLGGCAGSTAGGIKIARGIFLVNQVRLWLIKTLMSRKAVIVMKLGRHKVVEQAMTEELNEATLISFLWIVTIVVSVMLLSNILGAGVDLSRIIFEVCSAQGNVGISSGILTPAVSPVAKAIFMVDMWMGRLEIVPVILIARAILKGFG
ncbi:MAG: potassium transporter [Methanocella sp. PtaU1.Bin125]|nr:MAG: potassium transporter [Methanocella sp. PtaU1.Bin125]